MLLFNNKKILRAFYKNKLLEGYYNNNKYYTFNTLSDFSDQYLTFTAQAQNSEISMQMVGTIQNQEIYYKYENSVDWIKYNFSDVLTLPNIGNKIQFKNNIDTLSVSTSNYIRFKMSGKISASGNVQSMLNFNKQCTQYCFYNLFYGCKVMISAPILGATKLAKFCYGRMFYQCTGLTDAPALNVVELQESCYQSMFNKCTKLVNAPELFSRNIAQSCYASMFNKCTSLINAPELPATTLAASCYKTMFSGCSKIINAPKLPATQLKTSCYEGMFTDCTKMTTVPELAATSLKKACYKNMFNGCTSLTAAPQLPAIQLKTSCYEGMFKGCSALAYIKVGFSNWYADLNSTLNWVSGVSQEGTFDAIPILDEIRGINNIPDSWILPNAIGNDISDYTAFQVFANSKRYESGTLISDLGQLSNSSVSSFALKYDIDADMTDRFIIRAEQIITYDNDVIIDWGDGSKLDKLSSFNKNLITGQLLDYRYTCQHTYATSGKYVVKVYGNAYFAIMRNDVQHNLLCNCFTSTLPVASHLNNFASFCRNTRRLFYINFNSYNFSNNAFNCAFMFYSAKNLVYVYGCQNAFKNAQYFRQLFAGCSSLVYTDFEIPRKIASSTQLECIFKSCLELNKDIASLFPSGKFITKSISVLEWFYGCKKLYGTVPMDILMDETMNWIIPSNTASESMFSKASSTVTKQVPPKFGGTRLLQIIIIPNTKNITLPKFYVKKDTNQVKLYITPITNSNQFINSGEAQTGYLIKAFVGTGHAYRSSSNELIYEDEVKYKYTFVDGFLTWVPSNPYNSSFDNCDTKIDFKCYSDSNFDVSGTDKILNRYDEITKDSITIYTTQEQYDSTTLTYEVNWDYSTTLIQNNSMLIQIW